MVNDMDIIFPAREMIAKNGWTHQVQWMEDGRPCFIRCRSGREADFYADKLKNSGEQPVVIDLIDAMQLH